MPTPSSRHPTDARIHPFSSTCPDDQATAQSLPQPPSPSSWHPPLPEAYAGDAVTPIVALDLESTGSRPASRSDDGDTTSPEADDERPSPEAEDDDDEDDDEGHKRALPDHDHDDSESIPTDTDEELTVAGSSGANQDGPLGSIPASAQLHSTDSHASPTVPMRAAGDALGIPSCWDDEPGLSSSYISQSRVIPTNSSFLRPGSRFFGTQQSERQVYDVQVEIKYVDFAESFLCGYLRIQGLTEDHPTLTTYFEGEIVGPKYSFTTKHPSWGANERTDFMHWSKFSAFRPLSKAATRKGGAAVIRDIAQREHIFMRWKEHFLVPDHRVRTINGASFEGFYYICFNQVEGDITGIYFHSKSEKFQQLELKHLPDKGCFNAMEFR